MHKLFRIAIMSGCLALMGLASGAQAASKDSLLYFRGRVTAVNSNPSYGATSNLTVLLLSGPDHDKTIQAGTTGLYSQSDISLPTYKVGDLVVVAQSPDLQVAPTYSVIDHYRYYGAGVLALLVIVLVIIFARLKGLGSVIGLGISIIVITGFVIPQILHGQNPYMVSLVGSFVIALLGIYAAHGLSKRTTVALVSTYITLVIAIGASWLAVHATNLNGIASEDISYLHQQMPNLDIQGLLMGGIIIGVLGVLDDITVGQSVAVDQIRLANKSLDWKDLYRRGLMVGKEHIASLINTLVLAYVGTSFVFVVYVAATLVQPLWVTINSEFVMQEVIRSLVGSLALILAVPISTLLASYFLKEGWKSRVR